MTNTKEPPLPKIKKRKKREANRLERLALPSPAHLREITLSLNKKLEEQEIKRKYASAKKVLALLGLGDGLTVPDFKKFKEFNYCYLERTLKRLEKEKLVKREGRSGQTTFIPTAQGKRRIIKYALEELKISKPRQWDKRWTLVSYDVPQKRGFLRDYLRRTLKSLGFYPLHESLFLHAYPCQKEVEFLREYFGVAANVRIFHVDHIENDRAFRDFFGV